MTFDSYVEKVNNGEFRVSTDLASIAEQCVTSPIFSEDDLALKYSDAHLNDLRFTPEINKYHRLIGNPEGGSRWHPDTICRTFAEVRELLRNQSMMIDSEQPGKQSRLCSAATIASVEKLIRFDQRTVMEVSRWDANPMLLNTPTGIVNLETGKLAKADPLQYCTKQSRVGPSTKPPELWEQCLDVWTGGDKELQNYLQRISGYALTGKTHEEQFFFFHGSGANGKSTFLNCLHDIMGDYAEVAPLDLFTLSKFEKHPTSMAGLVGCRLALATETENGSRWAETQIKAIVDDAIIKTRLMRQDYFSFKPQFKLLISGNHKPNLSDVGVSMRRRINLIPFNVIVEKGKRDVKLKAKLRDEWPAILGWMIQGCIDWQRHGIEAPAIVRDATDEYLESQDTLGSWISECCVTGVSCRSRSQELHKSWVTWCEQNETYKTSIQHFVNSLIERPNIRRVKTKSGNFIEGIDLTPVP
jgi:putative DNA primase/helicase